MRGLCGVQPHACLGDRQRGNMAFIHRFLGFASMSAIITKKDLEALVEALAKDHLSIECLEARNSDSLDFHEVSVWGVKNALIAAFKAGDEAQRRALGLPTAPARHSVLADADADGELED